MHLRFEWDEAKAAANLEKHGVNFDEAQTVFGDPHSITIFDAQHSDTEDRFIDIGIAATGRILVVVYTENEQSIRIISGRKVTPKERRHYERQDR
jgi:uncharacterized protein